MGRSVWLLLSGALVAGVVNASCVTYARPNVPMAAQEPATCAGACDHYLGCKGDTRPSALRQCLAQCRDIFVTDGQPDRGSLREFVDLDCDDTIAFVEGTGGSAPARMASGPTGRN